MQATDGCTLVIDTSYGSTVGVVGHEPIVETDSRTHVEKLQVNIARAMDAAGLGPADIGCIVVGVGPAPFTGLRAGLVTAKALAFATGARLIGQNILDPQDAMLRAALRGDAVIADAAGFLADVSHTAQNGQVDGRLEPEHHITLCVNDARRKQLYFSLNHEAGVTGSETDSCHWIAMDIDYPGHIVERVNAEVRRRAEIGGMRYIVDVVGHGAARYADAWQSLDALGSVVEGSILDAGAAGLAMFAEMALKHADDEAPVEPLYLRRPDAEVPSPLKHVLNHAGAQRAD